MALHHAASTEIVDVRSLGEKLQQESPTTLVKTLHLQVFRHVQFKGEQFAEHKVSGGMAVRCLEDVVEFNSHEQTQLLRAGEFAYLAEDVPQTTQGSRGRLGAGDHCVRQANLRGVCMGTGRSVSSRSRTWREHVVCLRYGEALAINDGV